ncbi:hypothetical protein SARC_03572 [Sphaeroforma arctica JP610]|uniref:Uncharacterized protein n=1 Tax=Sphaeroforma arctica JP610 TaxID=667725 RepID=A0A0L0G5U8_9EUKA|nr:hypothetical protein SARC_03572 [Sphaeroforma arctica JP610]KNC84211.1 hypothetical protein SARC_03572 [Sphaeroforma arctica JP610]|eukprot:XP_014158113.1 hypothetical protein SARC_03572 [Sphaeroforma arctica JP610]
MSGLGLAGSVDPIQATSPGPRSPNAAIDSISDEFMEFYDADEHHPTLAKSANEKSYFGNKGSPSPAPLYASNRYYQHITHQPYPLLGVPSSQSFDQPSPHPGVTRVGRLGSLTEGTGLERYGASLDGSVRNSSRDVATGGNAEPLAREEVLPNDGLDGNRLLTKASSVTELMSAPQSTTSTNHSNNDHVNRCEREHRSGTGDRPSQEADSLHSTHRQSAVRMHSDGVCRDSDGYKGPGGAGNSRGGVNVRDSGLKSLLSTISNQTTASMERMLSSNSSTNSTHSFSNTAKTHNQVSGDRDTDYPIDDDHLDNNNNNTNNTKQSSTSSHGNSRSGRGRNVRTTESTTHVSSPSRHRRDRPRLCLSPGEPED